MCRNCTRDVDVEEKKYREPDLKPSNPKDLVGIRKPPVSTIPQTVVAEVGVGMMEGARKYGRHNYREIGVTASVYFDATRRHLDRWWEGEDIDPDSGLNHVTKAICSLVVLRDAMIQKKLTDDRPPKAAEWHKAYLQKYKGYLGSSEISKEDKCLYGKILFIDDLITYQANTYPELEREFAAAVDDYLETCQEVGKEPQKPFSGTFNVRIGPERHQRLAAIVAQDKSLKSSWSMRYLSGILRANRQ